MQNYSEPWNLEKRGKKVKKAKAPLIVKEPKPNKKGLILDTTCLSLGKESWESIYNLLEVEEPKELEEEATTDSTSKSENMLKELACSYLHRIAVRAKVLPYNDMGRWIIESIATTDKTFTTSEGKVFRSFREEDLRQMYHLPQPDKQYNKAFLEAFSKENDIEVDPIRQWRHFSTKHKHETSGMCSVDSLAFPYCYAGVMMCKLFRVHNSAKFSIDMVPLMEAAINGYIMDWANILSDIMATEILEYRRKRFVTS